MSKKIQELIMLNAEELKKYIAKVTGYDVNEIVTRVNSEKEMLIRFRHRSFAYSNIKITWTNNIIKHYLQNFETGNFEEITAI